jgi:glycogen debranching enzyme
VVNGAQRDGAIRPNQILAVRLPYSMLVPDQALTWLKAFNTHLTDAGLGQISEIVDGDAPHQPRGCIAQAWSVAELLRAMVEDVLGRLPGLSR